MQPVDTAITFVMLVYHHLPELRSLLKHNSEDRWVLLLPDNEMRYVIDCQHCLLYRRFSHERLRVQAVMSELVGSGADVTAGIRCAREYGRGGGGRPASSTTK